MTTYPQEFKDQLVALHRSGRTYMELGKEFNLAPNSISNWVRAAERAERAAAGKSKSSGESDAATIRRLEKELAQKTEEVEILGKAVAFFARRTDQ